MFRFKAKTGLLIGLVLVGVLFSLYFFYGSLQYQQSERKSLPFSIPLDLAAAHYQLPKIEQVIMVHHINNILKQKHGLLNPDSSIPIQWFYSTKSVTLLDHFFPFKHQLKKHLADNTDDYYRWHFQQGYLIQIDQLHNSQFYPLFKVWYNAENAPILVTSFDVDGLPQHRRYAEYDRHKIIRRISHWDQNNQLLNLYWFDQHNGYYDGEEYHFSGQSGKLYSAKILKHQHLQYYSNRTQQVDTIQNNRFQSIVVWEIYGLKPIYPLPRLTHLWESPVTQVVEQIPSDVDLKQRDKKGRTLLQQALIDQNLSIDDKLKTMKQLLQHGINIQAMDNHKRNALHLASGYMGQAVLVELLLTQKNIDVNAQDDKGWTALHYASRYNQVEICRVLLNHGADLTKTNKAGNTPLHEAIYPGNDRVIDFLLTQSVNINAQNYLGRTPLHLATGKIQPTIVTQLLQAKADITIHDIRGMSPLLALGIIYRQQDNTHQIISSLKTIVLALIAAGDDVNQYDSQHETLLYRATYNGILQQVDFVKFLLEQGANKHIVNHYQRTLLENAKQYANNDIIHLLE